MWFFGENSNTIEFNIDSGGAVWLYSFGNEHIITGEVGSYLFMEENYVSEDGKSYNRISIY